MGISDNKRKELREEDQAFKKDGGVIDWNYLLSRMDGFNAWLFYKFFIKENFKIKLNNIILNFSLILLEKMPQN